MFFVFDMFESAMKNNKSSRIPKKRAITASRSPNTPGTGEQPPKNAGDGLPSPEEVLEDALNEHDYCDLTQYKEAMGVLKNKGFSYRQIADWLTGRGIHTDHNQVYRVYTGR